MPKPRILLWDIESSHMLVYVYELKNNDYISHKNIKKDRFIFCISYKWYGESKIHTISILDDPKRFAKNHQDDYYVVKTFRDVMEKADAHSAHFGDGFDMKMLQGRMLLNGLKPLPKIISIDTCKIARRMFRLPSNKLDYLARSLGYKGKLENPSMLWEECFDGDVKALKHMARYNRVDIDLLEFVFEKLMPFNQNTPLNRNLFGNGKCCPNCGSTKLAFNGWRLTKTNRYQRYQCGDCGAFPSDCNASKDYKVTVK